MGGAECCVASADAIAETVRAFVLKARQDSRSLVIELGVIVRLVADDGEIHALIPAALNTVNRYRWEAACRRRNRSNWSPDGSRLWRKVSTPSRLRFPFRHQRRSGRSAIVEVEAARISLPRDGSRRRLEPRVTQLLRRRRSESQLDAAVDSGPSAHEQFPSQKRRRRRHPKHRGPRRPSRNAQRQEPNLPVRCPQAGATTFWTVPQSPYSSHDMPD